MAISRAQLVKELEPGLNALFGLEYDRYDREHEQIFSMESSDRAFEEEVMLSGFGTAPTKSEGTAVSYDDAQEAYTARYTMETIALAFSITEEAVEDNLYDRLASRYTKALARSMSQTKQVKAAAVLNNAFDNTYTGGDGEVVIADTVVLNINQGKVKEVMTRLVEVINSSYPAYSDGFVTIADDVTTTYLTSSAAADETVSAQYIHPDITSCGAITIAAANS